MQPEVRDVWRLFPTCFESTKYKKPILRQSRKMDEEPGERAPLSCIMAAASAGLGDDSVVIC